jgi:hypothetical protein
MYLYMNSIIIILSLYVFSIINLIYIIEMNNFGKINECINKYCKNEQDIFTKMIKTEADKISKNYETFKSFTDIKKYYKKFVLVFNTKVYKNAETCKLKHCKESLIHIKTEIYIPVFVLTIPIIKGIKNKPIYTDDVINDIDKLLSSPKLTKGDTMKLRFYMLLLSVIMNKTKKII